MWRFSLAALLVVGLIGPTRLHAQDLPVTKPPIKGDETNPPTPPHPGPPEANPLPPVAKPIPPVAIPDDPPPHEGAMIDLPVTVEPPDILTIDVLQALPGRPIQGEHLVKPDGKISLGFYGEIHVRGLTVEQVKNNIILHLRTFMNDEDLGMIQNTEEIVIDENLPGPMKPRGAFFDLDAAPPKPTLPEPGLPEFFKKPSPMPVPAEQPKGLRSASSTPRRHTMRSNEKASDQATFRTDRLRIRRTSARVATREIVTQDAVVIPARPEAIRPNELPQARNIPVSENVRILVDVHSYNSKSYYVQGDVTVAGRFPWTGNDTVLDALNYAGGLAATADREDIHLYRPARGGKPARDYKIDHAAILKGIATANFQLFPGDRVVVGRNPVIKRPGFVLTE